nr:hypothetical protein [Pseudomonadota bacterium]
MTAETAAPPPAEPEQEENGPLALRDSRELQRIPSERAPEIAVPLTGPSPTFDAWGKALGLPRWRAAVALSGRTIGTPPPEGTWALASLALVAGVGWVYERRRRIVLQREQDAALWPTERRARTIGTLQRGEQDSTADSSEVGDAGPSVHVLSINETTSRREATLVDLHQLLDNLRHLRGKRDPSAASDLLEAHLMDFRYTSPWVFLELRELYRELERPHEWELAREAFRMRFGQNAPQWKAASTAGAEIGDDPQLSAELLRKWPRREARMFILRWMLGDATSRQKSSGPPQLALGIYRDMMFLDALLDQAI